MEHLFSFIRRIVPNRFGNAIRPLYHRILSDIGAVRYRFPSRKLVVIGVTGTKGKTTTTELIAAILREAGYSVALLNTIHFVRGNTEERNLFKMTMPGRFFIERFLRKAVTEGCTHAVIEMSSEGVVQSRHRHIELDALVFTNISPEHIESHGSFENYLAAKLELKKSLESSRKRFRYMIANQDDVHGALFLSVPHGIAPIPFSLAEAAPYASNDRGTLMTVEGKTLQSHLVGLFNIMNIMAAWKTARALGISPDTISRAIQKIPGIPGRVQYIEVGQKYRVVVDYAHTPDSLEKLYQAFPNHQKICVLGNTGGGRDKWKRPEMARIAERYCDRVILTNEDPYDEDPNAILLEMAGGMSEKKPEIILDRRTAIRTALSYAEAKSAVLITGKGTDPYIMGPQNSKIPWSDADVAREELEVLHASIK